MTASSPLIVPVTVDALVVNDLVRAQVPFLRAPMKYAALIECASAEPDTFNDSDPNFNNTANTAYSAYYNGVYLRFGLPAALTQGTQDAATADVAYPALPNRWIVFRLNGTGASRQVTAWSIGSDLPGAGGNTEAAQPSGWVVVTSVQDYQGATITVPRPSPVGAVQQLTPGAWSDTASLGFTAMGPGNHALVAHQPDNNNVLSFIDPVGTTDIASDVLSYIVIGWNGGGTTDILAQALADGIGFAEALADFGWQLPPGTDTGLNADCCLFAGLSAGVVWNDTVLPAGGPPPSSGVEVAIGQSAAEALTTLIAYQESQATWQGSPPAPSLLEAFQLDLLSAFDQPDYQAALTVAIQAAGFQRSPGGNIWQISDVPGTATPIDAAEEAREATLLAALNTQQFALDALIVQAAAVAAALYVQWWKATNLQLQASSGWSRANLTFQNVAAQLDPANAGSLANTLYTVLGQITTQEGDIAAAAAAADLPATRQLQKLVRPPFAMPNDPVVALSGVGPLNFPDPGEATVCRFPTQLVTGVTIGGTPVTAATAGLAVPSFALTGDAAVPWTGGLLDALLAELFFLDPASASQIAGQVPAVGNATQVQAAITTAGDIIGTPPGSPANFDYWLWAGNPWRPLFLAWEGSFYPIPYGTAAAPNWAFADGSYSWDGQGASSSVPLGLRGRMVLTPQAMDNLQQRISAYLAGATDVDPAALPGLQALAGFVGGADGPGVLTQALDGFNGQLQMCVQGAYLSPSMNNIQIGATYGTVAALIGGQETVPPDIGPPPSATPEASANFLSWRAGQFQFTALSVVDGWGQALTLSAPITMQVPTALKPAQLVDQGAPGSWVQFQPALLQPARLDFELMSNAATSTPIDVTAQASPICGWIVPSPLDGALACYDCDGNGMGELRVGLDPAAQAVVAWTPLPGSQYPQLSDLAAIPHFGPFLSTLGGLAPADFTAFMTALDDCILAGGESGGLFDETVCLLGRPLALVRAQLGIALPGTPAGDPSWLYTPPHATPPLPAFTQYQFPIQLGGGDGVPDGLFGYFDDDDYATFNVVPAGGSGNAYLAPIGADGNYLMLPADGQTTRLVSLLMDPTQIVQALSGILPLTTLGIPPDMVTAALAAIQAAIRVGPIAIDQVTASDGTASASLPVPSGGWTWNELGADQVWTSLPVQGATPSATLAGPPSLRQGWLSPVGPSPQAVS